MGSPSLRDLLDARDARYRRRLAASADHPAATLVELSLAVPGLPKRTAALARVFDAARAAIERALPLRAIITEIDAAGDFALYATDLPPAHAKRAGVRVEESAPWGRLVDVDCFGPQGKVARASLDLPERRCLLCPLPHPACVEARRHPIAHARIAADRLAETAPIHPPDIAPPHEGGERSGIHREAGRRGDQRSEYSLPSLALPSPPPHGC